MAALFFLFLVPGKGENAVRPSASISFYFLAHTNPPLHHESSVFRRSLDSLDGLFSHLWVENRLEWIPKQILPFCDDHPPEPIC